MKKKKIDVLLGKGEGEMDPRDGQGVSVLAGSSFGLDEKISEGLQLRSNPH